MQVGDEAEVMVLDIDPERRRISLGMKQCLPNPWDEFAATHNKGDHIVGQIKSITDFGIFVGLEGGIDGLVHLSDLSWDTPGDEAVHSFKKGNEVEAIVLGVDAERERISLGIKQLAKDPLASFIAEHPKGSILTGTVTSVDAKGAIVDLGDDISGYLRASELSRDRVEDARSVLSEEQEVEARFVGVDRRSRRINISIKAKDMQDEAQAVDQYSGNASAGTTTLGDLLKEQISSDE